MDTRAVVVRAAPAQAFAPIRTIGGSRGWYWGNALWRLRGFLDLLAGGVGVRRGRTHPERLFVGDAVDWWRVEALVPDRLLRLRAEMRLPGAAWLEFEVAPQESGQTSIRQTAVFEPRGVLGLAYWYALLPLHALDLPRHVAQDRRPGGVAPGRGVRAAGSANGLIEERRREPLMKIARSFQTAAALAALVTLTALPVRAADAKKDIVDTAVAAGSFKTLATALQAAGLVETLKGKGPFTVFAPTDAAFAKLPAGALDALLKDRAKLTAVLTYHVVPGKVMAADVTKLHEAKTVQGGSLQVTTAGGVKVDAANVVKTDIAASNGVIHVIDSVLMPQ